MILKVHCVIFSFVRFVNNHILSILNKIILFEHMYHLAKLCCGGVVNKPEMLHVKVAELFSEFTPQAQYTVPEYCAFRCVLWRTSVLLAMKKYAHRMT